MTIGPQRGGSRRTAASAWRTGPEETMSQWRRHPEAEGWVGGLLEQYAAALPAARLLAAELMNQTSTRLIDWLDHLVLAESATARGQLADLGFEPESVPALAGDTVYWHPGAILPRLVLRAGTAQGTVLSASILVESAAEFLMTHRISAPIEGTPLSPYRRAPGWNANGRTLWVVERRGHAGMVPTQMPAGHSQRCLDAYERWAARPRPLDDRPQGMAAALRLARSLVSELGPDTAACTVFAAERAYWQRCNWAGQVQSARQDRLGLGWANHDHHTFRSSRDVFPLLIQILETLGLRPRERFHAGAEAGWGAQVMEQAACRLVVFADVDLSPGEAEGDFAHEGLAPSEALGTVGLWCALHGESMLSAGLHHLAGRYDFQALTADLAQHGVEMMRPFSDFAYLRQAFSRGERWEVPDARLAQLEAAGQIDAAQRERFTAGGAVGSHLENIQRGEGFKGFNQQRVSDIIRRTDPRSEHGAA